MRSSVQDARRQIDRLREALISSSPKELEDAVPDLAGAVTSMETSARAFATTLAPGERPDAVLRQELAALRQVIALTQKLIDRGRELCSARAIIVATAAGGYVVSGKPAALRPSASIKIEG